MQLYLIKTDVENSDTYIYDTKEEILTNTAPVKMKVVSLSKELFNQAMKDGQYSIVKKVYDKESVLNKGLIAKRHSAYWNKGQVVGKDRITNDYIIVCYPHNFPKSYNELDKDFYVCSNTSFQKGIKRPSENWVNKISKAKYLRCIKGEGVVKVSEEGYYDTFTDISYEAKWGSFYATHVDKCPCPKVKASLTTKFEKALRLWLLDESKRVVKDVVLKNKSTEPVKTYDSLEEEDIMVKTFMEGVYDNLPEEPVNKSEWTDKHYDFTYKLSEEEIEKGEVKLDVYKVAKVWHIGSKDDSGALWHCFKTCARFGDKNPVEREIRALYAQVKGLARENGVDLDE